MTDPDGTPPPGLPPPQAGVALLAALPPELAACVADRLTVPDALALARTRRDTPLVAAEVLGEAGVRRRLAGARPWGADVAVLLHRVGGIGTLCRAWGPGGAWSHARLLWQLERRLDPSRDRETARMPFGVATCDVPGSVMLVVASRGFGTGTLMRAVAHAAWTASGLRTLAVNLPDHPPTLVRWHAAGCLHYMRCPAADRRPPRLMLVENMGHASMSPWAATAVQYTRHGDNRGIILSTQRVDAEALDVTRVARLIAVYGRTSDHDLVRLCAQMDPPLNADEWRDMHDQIASLAAYEWLIIDTWLRRWQRWKPPSDAGRCQAYEAACAGAGPSDRIDP